MLSHKRKKTMKNLYELPSPDSRRCCRKDATGGVELREAIEKLWSYVLQLKLSLLEKVEKFVT